MFSELTWNGGIPPFDFENLYQTIARKITLALAIAASCNQSCPSPELREELDTAIRELLKK